MRRMRASRFSLELKSWNQILFVSDVPRQQYATLLANLASSIPFVQATSFNCFLAWHFDCAAWSHEARQMPKKKFKQEVEKELTRRDRTVGDDVFQTLLEPVSGQSRPHLGCPEATTPGPTVWR
jgi:hypothetical protein